MEFGVLGPVEARHDGDALPLGGPKQRALLAILLLDANEVVSRDRLIGGLWGERPPPSAAHTLDDYVSRLRKVLGADRIETRAPGYAVRVQSGELDLVQFGRLIEQGRDELARGEAGGASKTFQAALALWRGPALADVLYEPFASVEAERLEEKRLSTVEDRVEADLAFGRSSELVAELEGLVHEHPLRERLLGELMLALYRSGQQAKALELFRTARHRLAEELGLDPGPQLRKLERQILEQDPSLDPPGVKSRGRQPQEKRGRHRLIGAAVAVAAVAASAAVGIVLGTGGTTASSLTTGTGNELIGVSARSGRADRSIALSGPPAAIVSGSRSLWVADPDRGSVSRVDLASGTVVDRIPVGGGPGEVTVGDGSVWVASTVGGTVTRIDPGTGTITQTIRLGVKLSALAFGNHELWVADATDQALIRVDPVTDTVRETVSLSAPPSAVAVGAGAVWVASHDAGTVTEIDPRANKAVMTMAVGQGPTALAVNAGSVWVANTLDGTVSKIDPQTPSVVATIATGSGPSALKFALGSLWVANEFSNDVSRIDPSRRRVIDTVRVGGRPTSLAIAAGRLWIGTRASGETHRGGTLTLLGFRPDSIDPAFSQTWYPPPQFGGLAYDTLVTFEHTAGPDGLHLVPDLALALPAPTDAGRTYAFRLRPGIRYSDKRPLRASDFRRGIERLFRVGSPGAVNFTSIIGGGRCARHPRSCDLSHGIVTDEDARTVVFRLAAPDPELPSKLALGYAAPAPPGTPFREIGSQPIPGTGPYLIVRSTPRETRFVRNPRFREWSHAAQPAGYPDTIVWRYGLSPTAQTRAVQKGSADWMFQQIPAKLRSEIEIHHPEQLRVTPILGTDFLQINTHAAPFDNLRVRQALNYAIDRDAVVRLYGGASLATPTCQVLPPGFPGYRRYCPYTLQPRRDGRWTSPDRAQARHLIAASGTSGAHVTVWAASDDTGFHVSVVRYIAKVLRGLGYPTRARIASHIAISRANRRGGIQLIPSTWFGGELGPADFLQVWFACHGPPSNSWFCDPLLDQRMRRASALEAIDPKRAAAAWANVDRRVVDAAGWVPLVTPREVEFISTRVHNYQYQPIWGPLADQFWLR